MEAMNRRFVKEMQKRELTVSFAESVTCGLAAHRLSNVKGTLDVLKGSVVCYHPTCKVTALKISAALIKKCTPESQEVTDAITKNLKKLFESDIYAGITGLAAPGGSETKTKPVGTVFIAVLYKNKMHRLRKLFRGTPKEIREKATDETYRFILEVIEG
jgi:nicotinamide-nucleotide amidase